MPILRIAVYVPRGSKASPGTCIACGCIDKRACPEGCSWVDPSRLLCTACIGRALDSVAQLERTEVTDHVDDDGAESVELVIRMQPPPAARRQRRG